MAVLHCASKLKLFCYCAKWKKSLKRGLLVEQYLVVKVAAQRFMLFGFPIPSIFSFFEGAGPRLDSTIP